MKKYSAPLRLRDGLGAGVGDQLDAVAVAAAEVLDDFSEPDVVLLSVELELELDFDSLDSVLEPFDFFPASRLSVR